MTTMGVDSATVRHRWIGSFSELPPIWKTDMDDTNLSPIGRWPHARLLAPTARLLKRLGHKLTECLRNRRGYQELATMNDIELEDLGINRTDIDAIFAGTHQRDDPNSRDVIVLDQRTESRPSGNAKPRKMDGRNPRSQR